MHMSNSSQTVDALDHFYDENLALLQQNFVPLMSLFVLPLQINDKFHAFGQRLVAFGQLFEALVDIHLTQSYNPTPDSSQRI